MVVQGVMTLDSTAAAQYIVVERSLIGTIDVPDQDSMRAPPRPPLPISNARVVVTRDDGDSVVFAEIPDTLGVYQLDSAVARPFFQAGRVYSLRVAAPDGRVATGRMRMPSPPVVSGVPADGATFNRDRDTLHVSWSGGGATKGVFVQVRPRDVERRLTLFFFTDSVNFRMAGDIGLPFTSEDHPPSVWIAGTRQTFTVSAVDSNMFDFTRSGNEPFTGSGFINTMTGALGVFGGVAPVNRIYEVTGDVDHPWEGRYELRGQINGDSLGADLDLFVTFETDERVLVAALARSPSGELLPQAEASGWVENGVLTLVVLRDVPGQPILQDRAVLVGPWNPAGLTTGPIRNLVGGAIGDYQLVRVP